jgi:hypothetical protein
MFNTLETIFSNMIEGIISFVPDMVNAVIILLVGWIIASIARWIIGKLLTIIRFDQIVERTGLFGGATSDKRSPTRIAAVFTFWVIFLNFLLTAFDTLGLSQAVEPLRAFIAFLPQLVVGFILLIGGALLARWLADAIEAAVDNMGIEFGKAIANVVWLVLLAIVVIIVLQQMGIKAQLLTDIFTYVIVILLAGLALAFGLGGRDVVRNVLAGFYAREMFQPGDTIVIDEAEGTLDGIGSLNSEIIVGNHRIVVPNTYLTENKVIIRRE